MTKVTFMEEDMARLSREMLLYVSVGEKEWASDKAGQTSFCSCTVHVWLCGCMDAWQGLICQGQGLSKQLSQPPAIQACQLKYTSWAHPQSHSQIEACLLRQSSNIPCPWVALCAACAHVHAAHGRQPHRPAPAALVGLHSSYVG